MKMCVLQQLQNYKRWKLNVYHQIKFAFRIITLTHQPVHVHNNYSINFPKSAFYCLMCLCTNM